MAVAVVSDSQHLFWAPFTCVNSNRSVSFSRKLNVVRVSALLRPSPAESARTLMEVCSEGTLSTLSENGWPIGTSVQFALDLKGNPLFRLHPTTIHTKHVLADSRSSLHAQLDQSGRRSQCTVQGRVARTDAKQSGVIWARKFGEEFSRDDVFTMEVERVLQCQDLGEEEVWISGTDYGEAVADTLKDCAQNIVEDMNRKYWEDTRRFCKFYARIEAQVENASLTWVDRLGFDMRVLTKSPQQIIEVRVPFPREVVDERDARSSLMMMAQVAWEQERSPQIQLVNN